MWASGFRVSTDRFIWDLKVFKITRYLNIFGSNLGWLLFGSGSIPIHNSNIYKIPIIFGYVTGSRLDWLFKIQKDLKYLKTQNIETRKIPQNPNKCLKTLKYPKRPKINRYVMIREINKKRISEYPKYFKKIEMKIENLNGKSKAWTQNLKVFVIPKTYSYNKLLKYI